MPGATFAFVIDAATIHAIQACVRDKEDQILNTGTQTWRTITRYHAADAGETGTQTASYSPCGILVDQPSDYPEDQAVTPSVFPIPDDQIAEGKILADGVRVPLPYCERYVFVEPISRLIYGSRKYDVTVAIADAGKTLICTRATTGTGGRGGNVYGACTANIRPVLTDVDRVSLLNLCAEELLQ